MAELLQTPERPPSPHSLVLNTVPAGHRSSHLDVDPLAARNACTDDTESGYHSNTGKLKGNTIGIYLIHILAKKRDSLAWIPLNCTFAHIKVCLHHDIAASDCEVSSPGSL
jgi:hypothetical protein